MGTLRKMGAFLGLVPDESRHYSEHDDEHGYDAEYGTGIYPTDETSVDYGAYAGERFDTAGDDRPGYESRYADARYAADYQDADYQGTDHGSEYVSAGGYADSEFDDSAVEQPVREYAYAAAEPALQPTATRGSGRRGREAADDSYQTQGALAVQTQPRIEAVTDSSGAGKPVTVKLEGFADARQVGETYRDGVAVILDMTDLTDAEARRMVDFAAGLAFAVRGSIDKVTTKVFMLHPPTADADR